MVDEKHQEAEALRKIWNKRARLSQADFGKEYGIGNQSAVGQFLRGDIQLSFKAAKGFARGLGCQISDFSSRLSETQKDPTTETCVSKENQMQKLPADVARCEGREEGHPYIKECQTCLRKLSPPKEGYAWQVWIRGWGGHGECPDKLEETK